MSVRYEVIQTWHTSYGDDEIDSYGSFDDVETAIQLARQVKESVGYTSWLVVSIRVVGWK